MDFAHAASAAQPMVLAGTDPELLARIERCYDAMPRLGGARPEEIGPLVLFVRQGSGWDYYCRPRLGGGAVTAGDVAAARTRQRELNLPEAFEWVHEVTPTMLDPIRASGSQVLLAPLMVLDQAHRDRLLVEHPIGRTDPAVGATVRLVDPESATFRHDFGMARAVGAVGFGAAGTDVGAAGTEQRDEAYAAQDEARLIAGGHNLRLPLFAQVLVETGDGVVATGGMQGAHGCAEIVGVATLPSVRRRGLAALATAALARYALDSGADTVFLSAMSDDVARIYGRLGFAQVGTACITE
jgi:ribosomal protein S18 acetylase RimI-like enzyme